MAEPATARMRPEWQEWHFVCLGEVALARGRSRSGWHFASPGGAAERRNPQQSAGGQSGRGGRRAHSGRIRNGARVRGAALIKHKGGLTVPETADVYLNSQGVQSGRGGMSRAQRADGGRNRKQLPEPPGRWKWHGRRRGGQTVAEPAKSPPAPPVRSEWQGRNFVSIWGGQTMAEAATVRSSRQGVRSGRGGIPRAQRRQIVAETGCPNPQGVGSCRGSNS